MDARRWSNARLLHSYRIAFTGVIHRQQLPRIYWLLTVCRTRNATRYKRCHQQTWSIPESSNLRRQYSFQRIRSTSSASGVDGEVLQDPPTVPLSAKEVKVVKAIGRVSLRMGSFCTTAPDLNCMEGEIYHCRSGSRWR